MRKVNNSEKLPLHLTQEEYQEGTNEQVYLMSKEEWKSIFDNLDAQGENSKAGVFQKIYIT